MKARVVRVDHIPPRQRQRPSAPLADYSALRRPGSAHPDVYVHREAFAALREDGESALPFETIGLLYGRSWQDADGSWLVINRYVAALPGEKKCSPGHSSLTAEGNASLRRRAESRFPAEENLGWAHTHTGPEPEFSAGDRQQQRRKSTESVGLLAHYHGADGWRFTCYLGPDVERLSGGPVEVAPSPVPHDVRPPVRAVVVATAEPSKVHAVSVPPEAPEADSDTAPMPSHRRFSRTLAALMLLPRRPPPAEGRDRRSRRRAGLRPVLAALICVLVLTVGVVVWLTRSNPDDAADDRPDRAPAVSHAPIPSPSTAVAVPGRADRRDIAAEDALARYDDFWRAWVRSTSNGRTRAPDLAQYVTPRFLDAIRTDRVTFGRHSDSRPTVDLVFLDNRSAIVVISDCVGQPGKEFVVSVLAVFDPSRGWLIDLFTPHRDRAC